jgi:hypothetical protein
MPFLSLGLSKDEQQETVGKSRSHEAAGTARPAATTVASDEDVSKLPPAVEELRLKLAGNSYKPTFRRVVNDGTPTFSTFKFGYLPGRGLIYSVIAHELALFLLFMLVHYGFPEMRAQKLIAQNTQDHVIYLPEMGGGKEGEKSPGGGPSSQQDPSAAPAHASKGFAYPARQAILSDPPNPTNTFQTLQRPLIVHPAQLDKLVPLPNIVQMAETRLPRDLMAPKAAMPQLRPVPQPIKVKQDTNTHRNAKWKVPTNDAPQIIAKAEMPKLPAAQEPLPEAPKVQVPPKQEQEKVEVEKPSPKPIKVAAEKREEKAVKQVSPPSQAQIARMEMHGKALEPLLSLSPMPLPPESNVKIPNGEARGRFALAPGGTLNPNSLTPGKTNMPLSTSPGMGSDKSQAANAATQVASNAGTGAGHNPATGGGTGNSSDGLGSGSAGVGFGSGKTIGEGAGGEGSGKGHGSSGKGAGAKAGRGAGTGVGGGSGPASGAFQGITIQGGEGNEASGGGNTTTDTPTFAIAKQEPYGMTVVATASSGGGLPDFGVFRDEHVFTVYIPMRRSPEEEDPTWTLQYSMLHDDPANPLGDQTVLAPSPDVREWPQVPADLEKRYAQREVVLYAVVDAEGKVSQVSVKQTPDKRVSNPIVEAFSKWVFHPAQLNNKPVAVKVLIGVPL